MNFASLLTNGSSREETLTKQFYKLLLMDRLFWKTVPSESPRFAKKQAIVDELHRVREFTNDEKNEALVELDGDTVDRDTFIEASNNFQRPVIIRGFAKNTAAVRTWNEAYLAEKLGDDLCNPLTWTEDIKGRDWDVCAKIKPMTFREFFARMRDEPIYINANTDVVNQSPELVDDLDLDKIQESFTCPDSQWDELVLLNFFIGSSNVHSELHTAAAGNFFLMVSGRKRWTLMDPKYSAYIHPVTRRPFQTFRSRYGGFRAQRERQASPDHPLFRPPRHEVLLEPGDAIYNAPWWWHEVENEDDFTVGVAVRHTPPPFSKAPSWANHSIFTMCGVYPLGRTITYVHWLAQKLTGYRTPLRDILHPLNAKIISSTYEKAE